MTESTSSAPPAEPQLNRPYIGGQAVLEGVMMRSPTSFAVVVRRSDGSLHVRERAMASGRKGPSSWPFLRGVASLGESLTLGGEALRFSAEQLERDLEAEETAAAGSAARKSTPKGPGIGAGVMSAMKALGLTLFVLTTQDDGLQKEPAPAEKDEARKSAKGSMTLMMVIMVAFMIALPQAAAAGINKALHLGLDVQSPGFQALTGAFKLTIVVGYLLVVRSLFSDIRRVFQYHGAEHKTITAYEERLPLTVENARAKTTLHPRCGTTFLVMVALVSILVFTAVGGFLPRIQTGNAALDNIAFFAEKLPFLPVIAAVTFELQRVFARWCTTGPLRVLLWPGFLCQKITTIEPDDAQLEVALASLRVTLFRERGEDTKAGGDVRYANFDALMNSPSLRRAA